MRSAFLLILIATLLSSAASAQPNQSYERTRRQDPIVTSEQIEKLPVLRTRPRITLQHALKIAESYSKRKRINLSFYFLLEAKMIQHTDHKDREFQWYFRWVNQRASIPPNVEITVSMQGRAQRLPSK
jgi:hypothetical protein